MPNYSLECIRVMTFKEAVNGIAAKREEINELMKAMEIPSSELNRLISEVAHLCWRAGAVNAEDVVKAAANDRPDMAQFAYSNTSDETLEGFRSGYRQGLEKAIELISRM